MPIFFSTDHRTVQKEVEFRASSKPWLFSAQGALGQWRSWFDPQVKSDVFRFPNFKNDAPEGSGEQDPYFRQGRRDIAQVQWHHVYLPPFAGPWWKSTVLAKNRHYDLDQGDESANVSVLHGTQTVGIDIEKIYGVAQVINTESDNTLKVSEQEKESSLLGDIPQMGAANKTNTGSKVQAAYRHSQQWALSHEYLFTEHVRGPKQLRDGSPRSFRQQLEDPWGWFDWEDALYHQYYAQSLLNTDYVTRRPGINQVALQWSHALVEKSPKEVMPFEDYRYVTDHFNYREVATASFFQGIYVDRYRDNNQVSGQYLTPFIMLLKWSLSPLLTINLQESYYHQDRQHIFNLGLSHELFDRKLLLGNNLWFNDYRQNKLHNLNLYLKATERVGLGFAWTRDLTTAKSVAQQYRFDYAPVGRCWYASIGYIQNLSDKQITFDFGLNFDGQQIGFTPPSI